ncbi:Spy/CpxP family protein refolding chaperone [Burkholderia stagnalis]|nr:Spy/CpxP family protein refolding chaperone [Burkholderia stagnalis]
MKVRLALVIGVALAAANAANAANATAPQAVQPTSECERAVVAKINRHVPEAERRENVEQTLVYLHKTLKISQEQQPQWDVFAKTLRETNSRMAALRRQEGRTAASTMPPALEYWSRGVEEKQGRLDTAVQLRDAFLSLYASASPDQKAAMDRWFGNQPPQ